MVKKVVYPPKIRGAGPYDFTDSRDSDKQPSFLNKVKSFISFGKRALSGSNDDNFENSSRVNVNEQNAGNRNIRETSLSSRPFKYRPPDASFISNLTSRNSSRVSSLEARLSTSSSVENVTDKPTLLKYLNNKGFSDLESEGILAVAKQLKDSDIDNGNTGETTLQKVDYLTHSNQFSQYLKAPTKSYEETKNHMVLSSKLMHKSDANGNANLISETPNNEAVGNDTSMFMISANNTATQVMNSSIYSNTTMKRRRKRIYRYTEMGAPYKIGVPNIKSNRSLALRGNSTFLDYNNNSLLGNESFVNNTVTNILPIDNISKPNNIGQNENKVSSTALTLLETMDILNKSNSSSEKTKEPLKTKNITFINPYSISHLSKVSKPRKSIKKLRKDPQQNDLLTSIEESEQRSMMKDSPDKTIGSVAPEPQAFSQNENQNLLDTVNGGSVNLEQMKKNGASIEPKSISGVSDVEPLPSKKSTNSVQIQGPSQQSIFGQSKVEDVLPKPKMFSFGKSSKETEKTVEKLPFKSNNTCKTISKQENVTPFTSKTVEVVKPKAISSSPLQSSKNEYSSEYNFEFDVKQKYNVSNLLESEVKNYKSLYLF